MNDTTTALHIDTEGEYKNAFQQINAYLQHMQGDETKLTDEEHEHFREIALAIQRYEHEHFPRPTRQEVLMRNFTIGEWNANCLKAFRKEFNLTQANLAELLGVTQARLAEMERGVHTFSTTTRIALDRVEEYVRHSLQG